MKSKQKLKTKQKQQGKFENFPNLRTVDKEDVSDTVPETPLGLFFFFLEKLFFRIILLCWRGD